MSFFKENFKEGGFKIYNILVHLQLRSGQFKVENVSTTLKYLSKMHDLKKYNNLPHSLN